MKYYQKCVKFACNYLKNSSASGDFVPQTPYRGSALDPAGNSRPQTSVVLPSLSQTSFRRLCPFAAPPTKVRRYNEFYTVSRCHLPSSSSRRKKKSSPCKCTSIQAHMQTNTQHTSSLSLSVRTESLVFRDVLYIAPRLCTTAG